MELVEELKYYVKMFFKNTQDNVFSKDNKIMKTGKKGKLSFTKERLKFTLRGFAELQFL